MAAGPFSITLRTGPMTAEPTHGPFWNTFGDDALDPNRNLKYYVSLTQPTIAVQNITIANPAVVTAKAHGLSNGDRIALREVDINASPRTGRGMAALSGIFARVADATANTFTMKRLSDDVVIAQLVRQPCGVVKTTARRSTAFIAPIVPARMSISLTTARGRLARRGFIASTFLALAYPTRSK